MRPSNQDRRGAILILVLIVLSVLTLGAYSFTHWMRAEAGGAVAHLETVQARWLAQSGIEHVRAMLSDPTVFEPGAMDLENNPAYFSRVLVASDFRGKEGNFSIVAPPLDSETREIRYGLVNESAKIPLHRRKMLLAGDPQQQRERLLHLPNMTPDVADAILDWIDKDNEPRENGAEADYYLGLANPYSPRNAPPRTIGELLQVRGVTPWLLYGEDVNLNGILDPNENDGNKSWPPDNGDGILERGWFPFLTVSSSASNLDPDGNVKINLNDDLSQYQDELVDLFGQDWFDFVQAYKAGRGNKQIKAISQLIDAEARPKNQRSGSGNPFGDFGGRGGPGRGGRQEQQPIKSPWTSADASSYLDLALQYLTTESPKDDPAVVRGRIDVSRAPVEVVMALPGLSVESADAVGSAARERSGVDLSPAWIFTDGLVTLDEFQKIEPYITTQGRVYRVESIGYFPKGGPIVRVEAVVDASKSPAKILSRRELLNVDVGYPHSVLAEGSMFIPEDSRK